MTAVTNPSVAESEHEARRTTPGANPGWHEGFIRLMPAIRRQAGGMLRRLTPQTREEAVNDVLVLALIAYVRLVELGKQHLAYATPLARYSVAQYRAGRRVGVRANVRDVLSPHCQRRNKLTVDRRDRFDRRSWSWQEMLVEDKRFTPAEAAASRIDFQAWLDSLTQRHRRLAETLATGESTGTVARLFGLSCGRVSQLRRELQEAWRSFQNEPATA
jgi:hypothetical protein